MKSFFSRLNDIQASSSKPTKESSYKFWIPSNINTERTPPKPIPVHPDVAASHETRSRALKSTHALKIPLHDLPTAPIEAQAIHTTDMSRHTTKPNLGSSSMAYSQNYPPPSSRTPRIHEPNDRHPVPSRKAHGPADPIGTHTPRETSSKLYRGGRHESVAPVSREIWFPPAMPVSTKLHIQGTSEKLERYRESGDERDRVKELERREKDRDRREREGEKGRTREREKEEREREKNRAKERERGHGKDREITRAKRQLDRNWETDGGRERDKYAERDRREKERDSDREGDKVKNRTKDKGSRKESSNLTKGMERAWDSDVLYDEERTKQDERSKTRHRDRTTGGGGRDDNRDSHKERERWLEKEAERTRERLEGQIRHRVEATDGEQDARRVKTPAPDRERRKDLGVGWTSDTGHSRKLLRKTSNTLLNATSKAEEGESSDSSTRPKRVQVLTKRHRAEEGGSSSKIIHSRQGAPAEPLASTKSSAVKAATVTISEDMQLLVPPTPQHMPIYLPPKEPSAIDSGLALTIAPLNIVSARETETAPRKETVNRLKFSRPDEPLSHAAENVFKPREIDISTVRRPPSRDPSQQQNSIPFHPTIAPLLKDTRESVYIQKPKHSQPPLNDKLQISGSSPLPEMPHTLSQAEGSKEPNRSLQRLPDSRPKEVRHPMESTPQTVIHLASTDVTPPLSNSDPELPRKATHSLLQGSNAQVAVEMDLSCNLQLHSRGPAVMSGNTLAREPNSTMAIPAAQVVLGKPEPMNPPSNTGIQGMQSAYLNENIIQDSGKQTDASTSTAVLSKMNEVEVVTQPQNDVSLSPIKSAERYHLLYTEKLSIDRPSTAMGYRSISGQGSAIRPPITSPAMSPNASSSQGNHVTTTSSVDVHPKIPPLKSSQSRSNGQESVTRPSTTTGFRQNTSGKSLRHYNNMPTDGKILHEDSQATNTGSSHSDAQNNIGVSIPRPIAATAIKPSSSGGPSSRQNFNGTSHRLNPLAEEAHSTIPPGPSILQPILLPITEKGSGFPTQPYTMTPSRSVGPSLSRGHATVLPEDVTVQQDIPSHNQGHVDGAADLNMVSTSENLISQRNPTPLAISIPTLNDLAKFHSTSGASHHVPAIAQNSHQAFKENSVLQPAALGNANDDSGNNIIATSLNTKASNAQPIILASGFTAPQIQIQRPPTSISTRNDSVLSALPTAVTVPQIPIHQLITATSTGNKPEPPHTDFHAGVSTPRPPGAGADLKKSDANHLATVNSNVLPRIDQSQGFMGSGNKFQRPVHLVPASAHVADVNDVRPSITEETFRSHAEDPQFNISRIGSTQEESTQTFVNNRSVTLSYQPDPASSVNQTRNDSVQNIVPSLQTNNDLTQGPPSLGFFNKSFSEVLHSPVVQRTSPGGHPMKADAKSYDLRTLTRGNETDKDNGNRTINMKTSESLVNRDTVKIMLPKEPQVVPSVERLITRKDSHIDIHNSKVAFSQEPSEVNRISKYPPPLSQSRIQHPGLAEILSSPYSKDHIDDKGQPSSSSTAHLHPTTSVTVSSKSGSSPKFQGSLDKQRLDDKLVSAKSSPSRQSPSELRHNEVEQRPHESPKRQLQQTPTPTSRSAHLQNLLSDPHGGNSFGLTPSNVPSSSFHPPIMSHLPYTTSSVPDGVPHSFLEPMPHVHNQKSSQSGSSYPDIPISTGGPVQVEELPTRKIRPSSIVDSKPSGNNMPHHRATTPLPEPTSTARHQHSVSLPIYLRPSANVPSADEPLRSAAQPPPPHHLSSQTKPGYTRPPGSQTLAPNITHVASESEETILMTPSSLARSMMLKPTVSRQSVTPSMSSQTALKETGIFTMFRSKTPAQPSQPLPQYEIWHPNTSSKTAGPNVAPSTSGTVPSSFTFREQKTVAPQPTPVPVTSVPIVIEHNSQKSKIFTPFRYLTTKRNRAVSLLSVEAQDGTAPSTVVGSPTESMLSQAPFQQPPVQDPMQATEKWRNKPNGKSKIQRPGVVFDVAEERPEGDRQRPKRTHTRHKRAS